MNIRINSIAPLAGVVAGLGLAIGALLAPAHADTPSVTPQPNGNIAVAQSGCLIYFEPNGRLFTKSRGCTDRQIDEAYDAFERWDRSGGSYRGGSSYDRRSYDDDRYDDRYDDRLTCESDNGRREYCRANIGNGTVRLSDRKSNARCDQGPDWNYDNNGIWVDNGCRAEFTISRSGGYSSTRYGGDEYDRPYSEGGAGGAYGGSYQRVTCESDNGRYQYCRIHVGNRRVVLVDRKSSARCDQGDDWNYDNDGVWVENGCRAEFELR